MKSRQNNPQNNNGFTPMHRAAFLGDVDTVNALGEGGGGSTIRCNGEDGDGSSTYCVRSEGDGTMVRVFASRKKCVGTTFAFEQHNKRNPFRQLNGGKIVFIPNKKRRGIKKSKAQPKRKKPREEK